MDNIIKFPSQEDLSIKIEHTEDCYKAAEELSECIKGLPLNNNDNNRLIALITEQVNQAEQGAFTQGFELGIKLCEYSEED